MSEVILASPSPCKRTDKQIWTSTKIEGHSIRDNDLPTLLVTWTRALNKGRSSKKTETKTFEIKSSHCSACPVFFFSQKRVRILNYGSCQRNMKLDITNACLVKVFSFVLLFFILFYFYFSENYFDRIFRFIFGSWYFQVIHLCTNKLPSVPCSFRPISFCIALFWAIFPF